MRVGKTTGESALELRRHPLLCPRETWLRWRDAADLHDGPSPAGEPVEAEHASAAVATPAAGPPNFSRSPNHSTGRWVSLLRKARDAGVRHRFLPRAGWGLLTIARHGRWADNSAELLGHIREVSRWQQNPADGLDIDPETESQAAARMGR